MEQKSSSVLYIPVILAFILQSNKLFQNRFSFRSKEAKVILKEQHTS